MMSDFDPSQLTRAERQKVTNRAGRNIGSEVSLILTAGFALSLVVLFWFGEFSFLPLAEMFGISPTSTWIGLAVSISLAVGSMHSLFASRAVARARKQQFEIQNFDEANRRAETQTKIKAMKNSPMS